MFHENDSPDVRPARVCTLGEPSNSHIPASNGQQKLSRYAARLSLSAAQVSV